VPNASDPGPETDPARPAEATSRSLISPRPGGTTDIKNASSSRHTHWVRQVVNGTPPAAVHVPEPIIEFVPGRWPSKGQMRDVPYGAVPDRQRVGLRSERSAPLYRHHELGARAAQAGFLRHP
jgi:hypothetical protein